MPEQQVFSDRYELVRHIARGGMAQVYLAKDLLLDRPVALKVLFPELSVDLSFVERFRREAQAAANLSHPNIVSVYDWGQGERTYFIVMEFVDGQTLSQLIRRGPEGANSPGTTAPGPVVPGGSRISPERTAEIGADVAAALDFAHHSGVIHRDVKPGNVLIDRSGRVKVTDFGIARAVGAKEGLTQAGAVMGTATYFSPEQAQGFPVDARSDVYSLGVVLYEMAVGHPPFAGDNPLSIAYKHVREQPIRPTTENRLVPLGLEAIILKAMAKEPADRYQTAEELRADLLRFRQGQPVLAAAGLAVGATRVQQTVGDATLVAGAALGAAVGATRVNRQVAPAGGGPMDPTAAYGPPGGPGGPVPVEEDPDRTGLYLLLAVLGLILLAVAVFFIGRSAGWWGSSTKKLTIPTDVVGKSPAAATIELQTLGFTKITASPAASATVPLGLVATTNPKPGTTQSANTPIGLVVSSGPSPVAVPNVVNQTQAQATASLHRYGFVVDASQAASTTVTAGNVVSTTPIVGQKAAKGSVVQIVVSSGKPQVTVPPLVGETPTQAGQELAGLGLSATQQPEASNTIASGKVTRTSPPAGAQVAAGSNVTVFVSTGQAQASVPNLSNDTRVQAQIALASVGLQGNFTTVTVTDPSENGIVQSQNPPAGQTVNQGSTVTVTIGAYSAPSTTSPPTSPSTSSSTAPSTTTTSVG